MRTSMPWAGARANLATWRPGSQLAGVAGVARAVAPAGRVSGLHGDRSHVLRRMADLDYGRDRCEAVLRRLDVRDQTGDQRRVCLECLALDRRGRCHEAAAGLLQAAARVLTPAVDMLQHCPNFRAPSNSKEAR